MRQRARPPSGHADPRHGGKDPMHRESRPPARMHPPAGPGRGMQNPMHQFAANRAQPAKSARDGNTPCTVRRVAIRRCRATGCLARVGPCGMRQRKKDSTQMQKGCTRNTQMALSPAWPFTTGTAPGEPRRCGGPCPIRVPWVHLPASALDSCLLRRAPHAAARGGRSRRSGRTPCTNAIRDADACLPDAAPHESHNAGHCLCHRATRHP